MAYVIAEPCVSVKDRACVPACPVDCIYEYDEVSEKLVVKNASGAITKEREVNPDFDKTLLSKQLFIQPEECIDCSACVEPCPVDAIFLDNEVPDRWQNYIELNKNVFAP
jgi:NAD-dependent dihydropyrimidine dehydrogenase PreA subunit